MATVQLPRTQLTTVFRQALAQTGMDPDAYADGFATWKGSGQTGLLKDPYFGKDDPYARPLRRGQTVLWHVHLRPDGDAAATLFWDSLTRAGWTKTSDAVLVYTQSPTHGYLLLHAVWSTGAHAFANMSTPLAATLMNDFANAAEEFIFWGRVII
jgi:hypothetical protein